MEERTGFDQCAMSVEGRSASVVSLVPSSNELQRADRRVDIKGQRITTHKGSIGRRPSWTEVWKRCLWTLSFPMHDVARLKDILNEL